jgi:hypothetical protein
MDAGDIAAFIAAGASIAALGTSIYGVHHTTGAAARLELTKWSREKLAPDVNTVLAAASQLLDVVRKVKEEISGRTSSTPLRTVLSVGSSTQRPKCCPMRPGNCSGKLSGLKRMDMSSVRMLPTSSQAHASSRSINWRRQYAFSTRLGDRSV